MKCFCCIIPVLLASEISFCGSATGAVDEGPKTPNTAMSPELNSEVGATNLTRGIIFCQSQRWEEAIREFGKAIRSNPSNALAYEWRGSAFFAKGDMDKAIEDFGRAIQLNPASAVAYINRANAYRATYKFSKALRDVNESLRLSPTNELAYKCRASIYKAAGRFEKAISDCTAVLGLNPAEVTAYIMRGYCYRMIGQPEKAIADYSKAIQLSPKDAEALNEMAWIRATCPVAAVRDGNEAVKMASKACELTGWAVWQYVDTLAASFAEAGDFAKAIQYQKHAMNMQGVNKTDRKEMRYRLSLYEGRHPYREKGKPSRRKDDAAKQKQLSR